MSGWNQKKISHILFCNFHFNPLVPVIWLFQDKKLCHFDIIWQLITLSLLLVFCQTGIHFHFSLNVMAKIVGVIESLAIRTQLSQKLQYHQNSKTITSTQVALKQQYDLINFESIMPYFVVSFVFADGLTPLWAILKNRDIGITT